MHARIDPHPMIFFGNLYELFDGLTWKRSFTFLLFVKLRTKQKLRTKKK